MTTKEVIIKNIKEYKDRAEATAFMFNLIEPTLIAWEGKQMNKRFITKLRSVIGSEYTVYLDVKTYTTRIELTIRRGNKALQVWAADKSNGKKFSMTEFKKNNGYLYNQSEKYQHYTEAEKHIDEWDEEYQKIVSNIKELKLKMKKYECEYLIDWSVLRFV